VFDHGRGFSCPSKEGGGVVREGSYASPKTQAKESSQILFKKALSGGRMAVSKNLLGRNTTIYRPQTIRENGHNGPGLKKESVSQKRKTIQGRRRGCRFAVSNNFGENTSSLK